MQLPVHLFSVPSSDVVQVFGGFLIDLDFKNWVLNDSSEINSFPGTITDYRQDTFPIQIWED